MVDTNLRFKCGRPNVLFMVRFIDKKIRISDSRQSLQNTKECIATGSLEITAFPEQLLELPRFSLAVSKFRTNTLESAKHRVANCELANGVSRMVCNACDLWEEFSAESVDFDYFRTDLCCWEHCKHKTLPKNDKSETSESKPPFLWFMSLKTCWFWLISVFDLSVSYGWICEVRFEFIDWLCHFDRHNVQMNWWPTWIRYDEMCHDRTDFSLLRSSRKQFLYNEIVANIIQNLHNTKFPDSPPNPSHDRNAERMSGTAINPSV